MDLKEPGGWLDEPFDFVICSDVLEHVAPPVQPAFDGLFRLLKPGGLLLLSVPYTLARKTVEHYPELHDHRIENRAGAPVLINTTADGREQLFDNLVFHGGSGATLEMRLFSRSAVEFGLRAAGFRDIAFLRPHVPAHGIEWSSATSLVVRARR